MKLIKNTGNDRVLDALRSSLTPSSKVDIATPAFSLFAFALPLETDVRAQEQEEPAEHPHDELRARRAARVG